MRRAIIGISLTLLTLAVLSGCADKPGPPPGAPPATISEQKGDQQTPPTYGQTREEQKEGM